MTCLLGVRRWFAAVPVKHTFIQFDVVGSFGSFGPRRPSSWHPGIRPEASASTATRELEQPLGTQVQSHQGQVPQDAEPQKPDGLRIQHPDPEPDHCQVPQSPHMQELQLVEASPITCEVAWAKETQGEQAFIDQWRNSGVNHPGIDDKFKPLLFDQDGRSRGFPAPTRPVRKPRDKLRQQRANAPAAAPAAGPPIANRGGRRTEFVDKHVERVLVGGEWESRLSSLEEMYALYEGQWTKDDIKRWFDECPPATTAMLKQLPHDLTREELVQLLNGGGGGKDFRGRYSALYMPFDLKTERNMGYAFVNMRSREDLEELWSHFQGLQLA